MKKTFAFLLCILFALSLGGCKYFESVPVASHTGQFALPAGSTLPSSGQPSALTVPTSIAGSLPFRKTQWGMSRDDVIASEGRQPDESEGNRIAYNKLTVLDKECTLFYIFSNSQLVSAGYDFVQKPSALGDCVADYKKIVLGITAQYVPPASEQTLWSNGEFKNDPQKYGLAVLLGDLTYETDWSINGSTITCLLHPAEADGARTVSITATWQAPAQPKPTQTVSPSPSESATDLPSQSAAPSPAPTASESPVPSVSESPAPSASVLPSEMPLPSESTGPSPDVSQSGSFRNTSWGMAKNAVIASEGREPDRTTVAGIIYEDETFLGRESNLFYVFDRGALLCGGYDIPESGTPSRSIKEYDTAVSGLTKLYGDPAVSELVWSNPAHRGDSSSYGQAVAEGQLVYRSVWYTQNATVNCLLYGWGKGSQKKTTLTVSYQSPAASTADIETPPGYSFRQTSWGMSIYQVITSEGRQPDEKGPDYLIFKKEKYHNADCHIIYQFTDGGLVSGTYMIYNMHTDPNGYIQDYNTAVSILRQSYGAPQANSQVWNNPASRYKNDPKSFGLAVLRGDLSFSSKWALSQSVIDCSISLANTIVAVDITYGKPAQ